VLPANPAPALSLEAVFSVRIAARASLKLSYGPAIAPHWLCMNSLRKTFFFSAAALLRMCASPVLAPAPAPAPLLRSS
jgi:hypothetical protein